MGGEKFFGNEKILETRNPCLGPRGLRWIEGRGQVTLGKKVSQKLFVPVIMTKSCQVHVEIMSTLRQHYVTSVITTKLR